MVLLEKAEFRENVHEGPLYCKLLIDSHRLATLGQVFEDAFGIDTDLEAQHHWFWSLFEYLDPPQRIYLSDFHWEWVWIRGRELALGVSPLGSDSAAGGVTCSGRDRSEQSNERDRGGGCRSF